MSSKSDHHFADLLGSPSIAGSKKQTLNTIGKAQNTPLKNNSFSTNTKQNTPEMAQNAAKPIDTLYQFDSLNISSSPAFSVPSDSKISRHDGTNGSVLDSNWGVNETPLLATSGLLSEVKRSSNNTLLSSKTSSATNAFYNPADPRSNALSSFSEEVTWEIDPVNSKPTAPEDVFDIEYLNNISAPVASSKSIAAPRETSLASPTKAVERSLSPNLKALLNMGFEESVSIATLQRNNDNLEAAVNELIGGPSRSKALSAKNTPLDTTKFPATEKESASDKNKVMDVVNMGFTELEAKRALTVSNGDVQEALDILFFERERERSTTTADQLAKSASQFGISVFKNAKYVLNASKKKVEKILEKTIAPTSQYDQQPNDSWNSPVFKDEVPGNTVQKLSAQTHSPNLHPSVKNNFSYPVQTSSKPYMPTDLYSSADTFEIQLQSTFAPTPKKVETADLLIMDTSQGITTQQPETSWSIFDEPVTEASRPITQTSNVPGPNTTKVFPTPKNGIDPTKKQPQISSIPISKERARGNELFKQGQFGDAEKEYTKAIENLPPSHPELIILYNNRGACRIKIGDNKNAVNDCDQVLLVQPNDAKARLRRATAYEALENWVKAQEDYRFLMGLDSTILGVSTGLARCTAALNLESQRQQKPKPAVPKQSSKFVKEAVNEAVKKHRDKNDQVEREVNERFKQHDIVTDRINKWKHNKETNIRALLASLETVLWPSCEWKPVNLAELVTASQVKIKYLKAVGKVHPDKLSANCTVQEKLMASSIFTVLNKAWDAFKNT